MYEKKQGIDEEKTKRWWLGAREKKEMQVSKKEEAKGIGENEGRKKEEKKRGGVSGRAHIGWRRRQCGSARGERCSEGGKREVVESREGNK